ncbi:MAG TPA: glycosyltransferase family 1 protein [Solirubrobacteraceae bacterium]|nr:glycosyltransferase family 1 protein [Solirubrobacteraceae bacterium]
MVSQPRGWSRYVRELAAALGDAVTPVGARTIGPEVLWEQVGLPRVLRRRRASLVHAPNCFLPLRRPCPGVVTIHDLAFEAFPDDFAPLTLRKYRWFAPRAARSGQRVIVPSPFTGRDVIERYGIRPSKVRIVPEAPALPIGDAPPPAGGEYVLAVGDVRAKKNLGVLVEAARRLGVRAVVAGADAGGAASLRGPGVELTGWVDDARLDALMRGAAVLVHPSLYEGFGLVVVEAMARGVPVACANATALPETAAGAAELFDPHDPADVAAAIERARGRRDELAGLGRARAAELSWERTAALTRAVYGELV